MIIRDLHGALLGGQMGQYTHLSICEQGKTTANQMPHHAPEPWLYVSFHGTKKNTMQENPELAEIMFWPPKGIGP